VILCSYLGKPGINDIVTVSVETDDPCARYSVTYRHAVPCLVSRMNPQTGQWRDLWSDRRSAKGIGHGKLKSIATIAWDLATASVTKPGADDAK
jgi:hypothetical protein